jgi:hypothetical protein
MVFGTLVRACGLNNKEAGELLATHPAIVSDILSGRKTISQEFLNVRKWRDRFQQNFADVWEKHRDEFEQQAALLQPFNPGQKLCASRSQEKIISKKHFLHKKPQDEDCLGFALWKILGGSFLETRKAINVLQVSECRFYAILHNYNYPTQAYVLDRNWRGLLKEHYPIGWQEFGSLFEKFYNELPTGRGHRRKSPAPTNQRSLGYTLWKILGGPELSSESAAQDLRISRHQLSGFLHNKNWRCLESLNIDGWGDVLRLHYPHTWKTYGEEFTSRSKQGYAATGWVSLQTIDVIDKT